MQSSILLQICSTYSGNRRTIEIAEGFLGRCLALIRRKGVSNATIEKPESHAEQPLDDRWRTWREEEEIKRLAAIAWGIHPFLYVQISTTCFWSNGCLCAFTRVGLVTYKIKAYFLGVCRSCGVRAKKKGVGPHQIT